MDFLQESGDKGCTDLGVAVQFCESSISSPYSSPMFPGLQVVCQKKRYRILQLMFLDSGSLRYMLVMLFQRPSQSANNALGCKVGTTNGRGLELNHR